MKLSKTEQAIVDEWLAGIRACRREGSRFVHAIPWGCRVVAYATCIGKRREAAGQRLVDDGLAAWLPSLSKGVLTPTLEGFDRLLAGRIDAERKAEVKC